MCGNAPVRIGHRTNVSASGHRWPWFVETPRRLTSGDHPAHQSQIITLCLLPVAIRDPGQRFVIGKTVSFPDKSARTELSTTPQRAGSKVLFKLELRRDQGDDQETGERSLGESRLSSRDREFGRQLSG
ncbi:hypothetical protein AVEN_225593-1 [Araneus ventricosus]|uniref:Uncharacterized protein n=1 Tax=Araneus ventricosus TaxID=182803 RepID=A0A4Y2F1T3_ARAVE|nr:hypothetical protein AVEN_225593-1 [Araneus ventricosus]